MRIRIAIGQEDRDAGHPNSGKVIAIGMAELMEDGSVKQLISARIDFGGYPLTTSFRLRWKLWRMKATLRTMFRERGEIKFLCDTLSPTTPSVPPSSSVSHPHSTTTHVCPSVDARDGGLRG